MDNKLSSHLCAGEQEGGAENLHGVRGVSPAAAQRQQPVPPPIAAQGEGCRPKIHNRFYTIISKHYLFVFISVIYGKFQGHKNSSI